jgi:hypothetical protein
VSDVPLDVCDELTSIRFVPASVQLLRGSAELDDKVARQIPGFNFPAFFPPKSQEGGLIVAHDDAGVRAPDEVAAILGGFCAHS